METIKITNMQEMIEQLRANGDPNPEKTINSIMMDVVAKCKEKGVPCELGPKVLQQE